MYCYCLNRELIWQDFHVSKGLMENESWPLHVPHNPSKGTVGTSPAVEKAQFREFGSQVFLLQPQPPLPRISLESLNEATLSVKTRT